MSERNNHLAQRLANLERQVKAIKTQADSCPLPLNRQFVTPARFGKSQAFQRSWGVDKAAEVGTVQMWGRTVLRLDRAIQAVEDEMKRNNHEV